MIERTRHALGAQQQRHQPVCRAIGLNYIPLPVGDHSGKRLVTPQQEVDGAFGVGNLGRRQIALAILAGKAAGFQQRIAITQRKAQCRGQLQQDVAAAGRFSGLDITQMLDRDAGFKGEIGLTHGAAGAPVAQEVADRMRPQIGASRGT